MLSFFVFDYLSGNILLSSIIYIKKSLDIFNIKFISPKNQTLIIVIIVVEIDPLKLDELISLISNYKNQFLIT